MDYFRTIAAATAMMGIAGSFAPVNAQNTQPAEQREQAKTPKKSTTKCRTIEKKVRDKYGRVVAVKQRTC